MRLSRQVAGFTLLEILLVALLMALAAVTVTMSVNIGGESAKLEQEGKRFVSLMELLSEEAILSGNDFGVVIEGSRYQFLQLDSSQQWQPYSDERIFKDVDLGEQVKLKLKLEGFNWGGDEQQSKKLGLFDEKLFVEDFIEKDDEEKRLVPQIFLFSSGEMSAFTLSFLLSDSDAKTPLFKVVGLSSGQMMTLYPEDERWQDY